MLEVKNLKKTYKTKGGNITKALDDVSIVFPEKGLIFLLGKSGSGKSTLLNVIGGLDRVDSGEIIIKGKNSKDFSASDFDSYRNTFIGFIFQEYNILNEFNIEQNIALALQLQGKKNDKEAVDAILKQVDLQNFGRRKPNTLSGGQKQRVAIARALIKNPEIIMADEPTGALDSKTGKQIFDTLKELSRDKLIIVVSHDRDFAELYADRIIELADGKITSDTTKEKIEGQDLGNIRVVNDNTIAIKDPSKITKKDVDALLENLKNQKGEVLLTSGERNLQQVRQALHLSEDNSSEVFKDTKKVETKEYDPKQTKFIRSHLPFGRAFKMGASYLKLKPVRLVFTSLLTVISLTLFGVASTLMLFKDSYAYMNALKDAPYKSEVIAKQYDVKRIEHMVENGEDKISYTYDNTEYGAFSREEIDKLNENHLGLKFAPTLTFSLPSMWGGREPIYVNDPIDGNATQYYYYAYKPSGFIPTDKSYLDSVEELNVKTGTYPASEDEVAISTYAAEYFKGAFNVVNVDKLIGKTINLSINGNRGSISRKLKITALIETPKFDENQHFDELNNENTTLSNRELQELEDNFQDYMKNDYASFYFVSENFGESFIDNIFTLNEYSYTSYRYTKGFGIRVNKDDMEHWDVNSDNEYYNFLTPGVSKSSIESMQFFDTQGKKMTYKEPGKTEIYLPYEQLTQSLSQKYWNFITTIRDFFNVIKMDHVLPYSEYFRSLTNEQVTALQDKATNVQQLINQYGYQDTSIIAEDQDFKDIVSFYNTHYREYVNRVYLLNSLGDYFNLKDRDLSGVSWPTNVNSIKTKYEAITADPSAYDFSNYDELVEYLDGEQDKIFVYNIMDMIWNIRYNYDQYKIDEATQIELNTIYDNYQNSNQYPSNAQIESLKAFYDDFHTKFPYEYEDIYFEMPNVQPDFTPVVIKEAYYKNYQNKTGTLKVLGYVKGDNNNNYAYLVSDALLDEYALAVNDDSTYYYTVTETDYVAPENAYYSGAITRTNYTQAEIEFMQQKLKSGATLLLTDGAAQSIGTTLSLLAILKPVFLITGAVLGVFAALMLLNYVSTSIANKTREIGILRAVGARGSDLFKIFFSESGLMTAICLVISLAASIFTVYRLNLVFMEGFIKVALLSFSLINVGLMLLGAIVIAVLGTIIPVVIAARKQPVESIRSL